MFKLTGILLISIASSQAFFCHYGLCCSCAVQSESWFSTENFFLLKPGLPLYRHRICLVHWTCVSVLIFLSPLPFSHHWENHHFHRDCVTVIGRRRIPLLENDVPADWAKPEGCLEKGIIYFGGQKLNKPGTSGLYLYLYLYSYLYQILGSEAAEAGHKWGGLTLSTSPPTWLQLIMIERWSSLYQRKFFRIE